MTRPPDLTWIDQAACRDEQSVRFIDPADDDEVRAALSVCQRCPVRQPCLDTALTHRVEADVGIWGGTTPGQRRQLRRDRRQPEPALNGHRRQATEPLPAPSCEPPPTRTPQPPRVRRLPAPEVTVARDKYGDYVSADGRVLIFRIQGALPWVLAIDDQIIGASRTVTEARRTAWTTLDHADRTAAHEPLPAVTRAQSQRR